MSSSFMAPLLFAQRRTHATPTSVCQSSANLNYSTTYFLEDKCDNNHFFISSPFNFLGKGVLKLIVYNNVVHLVREIMSTFDEVRDPD